MEITREIHTHGNYCPAAVNLLQQIPPAVVFNIPHQLRHPESIYRLSLEKVGAKFREVTESYRRTIDERRFDLNMDSFQFEDLLGNQEGFLHALQEHVDELWLILKTLVDPAITRSQSVFSNRYVLESKLPGAKSFSEAIYPYRNSLQIVNKLKHQQGHLRGVAMWTVEGPFLGYFLEEPDRTGSLGPSLEVHPDQAALSFARDLLWHLMNIYICSDKLALAVQRALAAKGVMVCPSSSSGIPEWNRVLDSALSLPEAFFPSDERRGVPLLTRNSDAKRLTFRFPRRVLPRVPPIIRVGCTIKIDGHSPSFKTPLV